MPPEPVIPPPQPQPDFARFGIIVLVVILVGIGGWFVWSQGLFNNLFSTAGPIQGSIVYYSTSPIPGIYNSHEVIAEDSPEPILKLREGETVFGGSVAPNSQGIVEEVVNGGFRQLVFTSFVSETQVVIAEEDLSMTLSVPVWSSDGSYIAYRRIMLIGLDVPGAAPPPSGVREGTVAVGSQVVVRGLDGTEIFSINSGAVPRAFSLQNTQLLVQKGTKFVLFNISDGAEREVNGTSKLISDSNFSVAVSLDSELLAVSGEGRIIWGLIDWGTATLNTLGNIASAADSMVFNSNDELLILHGGTLSAYALGEDGSMQKVGQSSSPGGENIQLLSWTL